MRKRPDNDMTRKLRPLVGEEEPDGHNGNEDSADASPSAGDDFQDGPLGKLLQQQCSMTNYSKIAVVLSLCSHDHHQLQIQRDWACLGCRRLVVTPLDWSTRCTRLFGHTLTRR